LLFIVVDGVNVLKNKKAFLLNIVLVIVSLSVSIFIIIKIDNWFQLNLKQRISRVFSTIENKLEVKEIFYILDNRVGWRLNPHTELKVKNNNGEFSLRTNSDGFIDREHYINSSNYRIAIVGDSWVEAQQVPTHTRFTDLLEVIVATKSNYIENPEILNFGISSLGTGHEYGVIKNFVLKYELNEIWLVFFSGNDFSDNSTVQNYPPFGPRYVYKNNNLIDIQFGSIRNPQLERNIYDEHAKKFNFQSGVTEWLYEIQPYLYNTGQEKNPILDESLANTYHSLKLISEIVSKKGILLKIVYLPSNFEVDEALWNEFKSSIKLNKKLELDPRLGEKKIKEFAGELNIEFISLFDLIKGRSVSVMYDDHFSLNGHYFLAHFLADYYLAKKDKSVKPINGSP
jgi:hypothetical protein